MIIELGIVAAAAAVSGLLAARALRKKRDAEDAPPASAGSPDGGDDAHLEAAEEPDPFAELPAKVGDVIQAGEDTRWPRRGLLVHNDSELLCAVLLSEEGGERQATVAMSPPDHNLYWLLEHDVPLPSSPPARLEVDGYLLDRRKLLSVALQGVGDDPPELGVSGRFALYEGSIGDAAVVLVADVTKVWYGRRLAPDDFDRLGDGGRAL